MRLTECFELFIPPGFHKQRRIRNAESHVPRPLGGDARIHVEDRKYGGHLRERDRESLVFVFGNGSLYQKTFEQGARTSRYIKAQPNNVMDRKIGEATLNIFSLRCWYMYATKTMVPNAQKIETASNVILDRLRSNAK